MYELRRIGERSVGRLYGIAGLIVGVIAGVLFTPFLFLAFRHTLHAGWIAIPVFFAIVLIVGIVCALDGLIASFLYNILASYIGGVKMEIKRKTLVYVDPQSYAKINTALAIIFMVIAGLIILIFAGPLLLLASRAGPNVTSMFSFAGPYIVTNSGARLHRAGALYIRPILPCWSILQLAGPQDGGRQDRDSKGRA